MGVPDDFVFCGTDCQNYLSSGSSGSLFCGTDCQNYQMIGNGVPVPIGRWLGGELKRYFKKRL